MRAVWYERQGAAGEVLQVGELPDPVPGPGEVRVRVTFSGVNPGDTKKRRGWLGSAMPFPRVVPHSDGAGVLESVGEGVDRGRVGRRVWVFGAQSYRPFGTAAQLTVVPAQQAIDLPDGVSDEVGACLGIPGITAHRAVFADGPVAGRTVLVQGVLGGVGALAAQLASWAGASVIGTVRQRGDLQRVNAPAVPHVVALDQPDPAGAIRAHAPDGVDRIIEVAFSDNIDLDAAVADNHTVIAAYATRTDRPGFPFWPLLFDNVTIRLLGSDDFPPAAKQQAAADLTAAAGTAPCRSRSVPRCPSSARSRPMIASTPAPATGSCCQSPTDRTGRPAQRHPAGVRVDHVLRAVAAVVLGSINRTFDADRLPRPSRSRRACDGG